MRSILPGKYSYINKFVFAFRLTTYWWISAGNTQQKRIDRKLGRVINEHNGNPVRPLEKYYYYKFSNRLINLLMIEIRTKQYWINAEVVTQ